jgi:hypothetical protein
MTTTNDGSGKTAKRPTLKWYWSLLGFGLLGYGAFVLLLPVWDSIGVESIRCDKGGETGYEFWRFPGFGIDCGGSG